MREYIFTEREREIAVAYVNRGIKLDGFQVLAGRIRKNAKHLMDDVELLKFMLKKLEEG